MAVLGMTKLEAVNAILRAVGDPFVAALNTAGNSEASEAERLLDYASELVQTRGWPGNTTYAKAYTAAGGSNEVTFGADTLRVDCVAPGRFRGNVTLQGDKAYICSEGTTNFGSGLTIYCDVVRELAFEDTPPDLRHAIVTEAAQLYRRRKLPNAPIDAMLGEEKERADMLAARLGPGENYTTVRRNRSAAQPARQEQ